MQMNGVPDASTSPAPARRSSRTFRPKVGVLAAATLFVSINIWTGCPLVAVYIGSHVEYWVGAPSPSGGVTMTAVFTVVIVLAVLVFGMAWALVRLGGAYDRLVGRPAGARQTSPWLRSLRGEREDAARERRRISLPERIVVLSVLACALTFEVWFFFFAGSSLPHN